MLTVYAAKDDRLHTFAVESTDEDCDERIKSWLYGLLGSPVDADAGDLYVLAVSGKPGATYTLTQDDVPVAVVVRS